MNVDPASADDLRQLCPGLPEIVRQMTAPEELAAWLRAQPNVVSVTLADYLIKTNPPRREFLVQFRRPDGTVFEKAIEVVVLNDRSFQFHSVHAP
jgi:hypothetical protein